MVGFDPGNHLLRSNHVHAARQILNDRYAEPVGVVAVITIAQRDSPRPPATAIRATGQLPHFVDELMIRVGFPMRRFTSSSDDDAGTAWRISRFGLDRRSQMHGGGDPAQHSLGMVNEPDELAQIRFAAQVDHAFQLWMVVTSLAHLHKLDPASEMIDDFLVPLRLPPFDRDIEFAACDYNPEGCILPREFLHLGVPPFLLWGQVNIPFKGCGPDLQSKVLVQKIDETMQTMVGNLVRVLNEWILTIKHPDAGIILF